MVIWRSGMGVGIGFTSSLYASGPLPKSGLLGSWLVWFGAISSLATSSLRLFQTSSISRREMAMLSMDMTWSLLEMVVRSARRLALPHRRWILGVGKG